MKDTTEKIERLMRDMMMRKTGAQRLEMGLSMFDMAKSLILASLKPKSKAALFLRIYGNDFDADKRARILKHLER